MKKRWKRVSSVDCIKGDLVRLKMPNGTFPLISKFQAMQYANESGSELWIDETGGTSGMPSAEMRQPQYRARNG
jgi:hypothetical protein